MVDGQSTEDPGVGNFNEQVWGEFYVSVVNGGVRTPLWPWDNTK